MSGTRAAGVPMELSFETYDHGKRNYSIYDMNSVGKAYKNSAEVKIQRKRRLSARIIQKGSSATAFS